jgi:DNA end-binding protein Ku
VQTIWRGTIAFGLVSIPVRLFAATEQHDISFLQVHDKDGSRIRYRRFCEKDDQEVPYADVARGYELPDGRMVMMSLDDFGQLPVPTSRQIHILEFVPIEQVDPVRFAQAYYLSVDLGGARTYVLLREALERSGRCAIVKVAIRTRETLALLRVSDGVIVMQTMLWPDEVRDAGFARPHASIEVKASEVAMAKTYIKALQTNFDPDRYRSDFRDALQQLIAAKVQGYLRAGTQQRSGQPATVDLLGALKASVANARKLRTRPNKKTPTKRAAPSAAKKTATRDKKAVPRKASSKKTAGKSMPSKSSRSTST